MKKVHLLMIMLMFMSNVFAQHNLEVLDRGVVAVKTNTGVFVSWRIPGEEWHNVRYNVYRDGNKLNSEPLDVSNYSDLSGTIGNAYTVSAVIDSVEQPQSASVNTLSSNYKEIQFDLPPGGTTPAGEAYTYTPNDFSVGMLDGDASYDLVVKWDPSNAHDNSHAGYTGNVIIDGYTLGGNKLWRIDLGKNIRAGAHYTQFMVYDLDGDGIAEIACKTAPGTIDGLGNYLGKGPAATDNDLADYRNTAGYILTGPEYLTVFNGQTGAEMATVSYVPPRGNVSDWGDEYGNRVDRFLAGVAYLDGIKPSIVMARGYYTRTVLAAWDWDGTALSSRWVFDTNNAGNGAYYGQGNHNLSVSDVDNDGRDEIIYGSMTVDDDGTGLYTTGLGHGDAMHVGDLDPYRKGIEAFRCLEGGDGGTVLHDAATGQILIRHKTYSDCGRCCAANISNNYKGAEVWGGGKVFAASTGADITNAGFLVSSNFRIYWDGDLLEELLDNTSVTKTDYNNPVFSAAGAYSNNGSKSTSCLQADILGDWREELIFRTSDPSKVRIYTTTAPTIYRNYTLMHDRQYRLGVAWENVGYNQPPHTSYFLGEAEGILLPPPPVMNNQRLVYNGTGTWDNSLPIWMKDGVAAVYTDGEHVYFNSSEGTNDTIGLSIVVSPDVLTVVSPGNYTLDVDGGKLTGEMKLVKQGIGQFSLNGVHDYTGVTEIWDGTFNLDGDLTHSAVWVNMFGQFSSKGKLGKGLVMRYSSKLVIGGNNNAATLTITDSLSVEEKTEISLDIFGLSEVQNDSLKINGNMYLADGSILNIVPHLSDGEIYLAPGEYLLASATGNIVCNIEQIELTGIEGMPASLIVRNDSLLLNVKEMRSPSAVIWNGSLSDDWDLVNSKNFLNASIDDIFVTGDEVTVNDDAVSNIIDVVEDVMPASLTFVNNSVNYTISGSAAISGNATLTKKGSGKVTITNTNDFSGKVLVEEGTLEVKSMPNSIDGNGAIGGVSGNASLFEINGGTFSVTNATTAERALTIGVNGGTIQTTVKVNWNGKIVGGTLTKTGGGELTFNSANANNELILQTGTVRLTTEEALPGRKVIFRDGVLNCYDNGGTYSLATYPLVVEEGQKGTIYVDGRCEYRNTLTGSGTLNVSIPWIRTDFTGNWSAFEGTINLMGASWFRNFNSYGYGKAKINMPSGTSMTAMNDQIVKIGSLIGAGNLSGSGTWELGSRNESFMFRGVIESGSINKVGTGIMTLTNASTLTGLVTVTSGGMMVINSSGSATGTGTVYVKDGAFLGGMGIISGSVIVQNGGILKAGYEVDGYNYTGTSLRVKSATLNSNSVFYVKTNTIGSKSDKLIASESFIANGQLVMNKTTTLAYSAGQTYQIVSAPSISGAFNSVSPETPGDGLVWDFSEFNTSGIVKVNVANSITNVSKADELSLYPNPSSGVVYINFSEGRGNAIVQIETLNGEVVSVLDGSVDLSQLKIDLGNLDKGVYLIRACFNDKVLIGKVILK
ncbi:MAG: autotransporter-associated beta strand repeat-containing protein [Marinilabiliaceae bacterium]|nr:autotransporter-associated beta strand repeat-containing protein [Marinilabiliaceae bacterium]